ncbi:MAG: valine--tRNA ligase [Candidatus Paceibacterota bacterium]
MDIPKNLDGQYDPADHEARMQQAWQDADCFNPDNQPNVDSDKEPFSMVLPPPNVTGTLHVGHAMMVTVQDILARYHRMCGQETLWLPGTDHAAIATQSKVERQLKEETGQSRFDLGREEFLKKVEGFAVESHATITAQLEKMGASVDWSREAFTLDEAREKAVRTAFRRMYEAGLIYRGDRVINWDPVGGTTVSDDEVDHVEETGSFWTFRYDADFPIAVSTTRPETKLGDTAIAVHPDDERYAEYVGQTLEANFLGVDLEIQVVADDEIDPDFGTGAVGVTPAHSMTDWDIAKRHDLPLKQVIGEDGRMTAAAGDFAGMTVNEARKAIVEKLDEAELIEETEEVTKNVGRAERTDAIIEHLPKKQWFVNVSKKFKVESSKIDGIEAGEEITLKELMQTAVASGQINITPDRFEKNYNHWIDNLRDWCISRQIWYGHRIPVWYHESKCVPIEGREEDVSKCEPFIVSDKSHDAEFPCPHCGAKYIQDSDTLDTWFSSGLWTFSTLGWPEETKDFKRFHPTNMLVTAYDIIFFWVARMILMTGFLLEDVPFTDVYFHGLVRDGEGVKMSKSLGNTMDPVDVINEHGADALRMALIDGTTPGQDSNISDEKIKKFSKFANKIWNATKFVMMNLPDSYTHEKPAEITGEHQAYLDQLAAKVDEVTANIDKFQFNLAAEKMYEYFWHVFADEIIEATKGQVYGEDLDEKEKASALFTLYEILTTSLTLLHPFMPHLTETLWQELPDTDGLLTITTWPNADKKTNA